MAHSARRISPHLPVAPIRRFTRPLSRFLRIESASGIVLLLCTVLAIALANSNTADAYHKFWHTHVQLGVGPFTLGGELGHFFVNDVLMTIFFFVVGLEIKRELVAGELRDARKAALPVAAALGGMLVPAGIYMALQANHVGEPRFRGWGVPMATDIAFVVGIMAVLGKRVPFGLKIMLLSLAIADDIGAVIVIAAFYSAGLNWFMLLLAAAGFAVVRILNESGVRSVPVYTIVGAGIWLAVYKSGVHPTVAGVLLGLLTPSEVWVGRDALRLSITDLQARLEADTGGNVSTEDLELLAFAAQESVSPLERLEHQLHPWVGFAIMPLFALANAGVHIELTAITEPVSIAVMLGLFLGKPVGVMLFSFLAVRAGIAKLPHGVNWFVLLGGGFLAGIGFTMSLFVAGLAFEGNGRLLADAKIGILFGSVLSAVGGAGLLILTLRKHAPGAHTTAET
ncbi:sodium:proton antiporter : Na(+)/H(+) antiporter NhaA OS=Isosphaera pallida (strain ATCC 43644 / DSM 9630 / IS1B) GN=nhaA PE=3 SV=1: Na_H_antiport_1 [Gemmata massiliana]|uniref:Na(+)/H(+) antiporter NhaA n=1 Tax=Gemmata massiliana TaxID=1210884 RepID=A0A6P2D1Z5_9BACT|nr:Na+/H+ antiporter NhaA [Gemmata massiliana]VTR95358.1 sodium:proton antiporter : Na(+)/H(+) antiporter NhaA OS=Isosphaera pallida (strain ATCC 43644 / DSM 9630 / IS1B) GN=nhaA PE=3 SV=1: Na_H_antiport_1 [Gemmata massiliana]